MPPPARRTEGTGARHAPHRSDLPPPRISANKESAAHACMRTVRAAPSRAAARSAHRTAHAPAACRPKRGRAAAGFLHNTTQIYIFVAEKTKIAVFFHRISI